MNPVYRFLSKLIDGYAYIRDRISPGWSSRNSSRIREWKLMAYAFGRSRIGVLGGFIVAVVIVIAIVGPAIAWEPYWEYKSVVRPELWLHPPCLPPGCSGFPLFGTDEWGRDIVAMSLYGFRISLVISVLVVILGAPLGILLGLLSGYRGGWVDEVVMRLTDIFIAFPGLILAIAFASVLPRRIREFLEAYPVLRDALSALFGLRPQEYGQLAALISVWIAMVLVWWPGYARIVRGSVLSVRELPFVEAAKLLGIPERKILLKHILPNVLSPVIVMMTFDLATATLFAAALSYLGLGPQEPVPELGFMISKAATYFPERSWHVVIYYGTLLLFIALGWNLLGDALRDVLDPRTRRAIEFRGG
ncbi:MAG: ABC transporter permease [Desulfurococcaceae archaeon]|nr:ABC transporter permease [Desulfurococcaceae archaeon]